MSVATPEEIRLQAQAELKKRQMEERANLESIHDWYGLTCPCKLPPGDCRKHPRARPKQRPPGTPGSPYPADLPWSVFLMQAGRGGGKTRAAAEFVRWKIERRQWREVIIVGTTFQEVVRYQINGHSGLKTIAPPWMKPQFLPSYSMLQYPNGAKCYIYTSEKPNSLRGGNIDGAWCDEVGKWEYQQQVWDQVEWVLRNILEGGRSPQNVVSTTPTTTSVMIELNEQADQEDKQSGSTGVIRVNWNTEENAKNLDDRWLRKQVRKWKGSLMGSQELAGELIRRRPGALWEPADFAWEGFHFQDIDMMDLEYIGVAVDPSAGSDDEARASETGIILGGRRRHDPARVGSRAVILGDFTKGGNPGEWGKAVVRAYHLSGANCVIAEKNQGGEMVRHVIQTVPADPANGIPSGANVPVELVYASVGKQARAEPIAALYSSHRVQHLKGATDLLERQMIRFLAQKSGQKLDRVDALVWLLTKCIIEHDDVVDAGPIIVGAAQEQEYKYQGDARLWMIN